MIFREAALPDIEQMSSVRLSVKENVLSDPALITYNDYVEFISIRGKGWVGEIDDTIVGFSVADIKDNNIWALFVHPHHEGKGIGRKLHDMMLDWYFNQGKDSVWLSTAPSSRAERFYRRAGWKETGITKSGEVKFEMSRDDWRKKITGSCI